MNSLRSFSKILPMHSQGCNKIRLCNSKLFLPTATACPSIHNTPRKYFEVKSTLVEEQKPNRMKRFFQYIGLRENINQEKLKLMGYMLYKSVLDINYTEFFHAFHMPDTYRSWFAFTELHVWMLMVRVNKSPFNKVMVSHSIISEMWEDAENRTKVLLPYSPSKVRNYMTLFNDQFHFALVLYDEALQCSDVALANALWYHFFEKKCTDPRLLEALVGYIREQINHLLIAPVFEVDKKIEWLPLKPHLKRVGLGNY